MAFSDLQISAVQRVRIYKLLVLVPFLLEWVHHSSGMQCSAAFTLIAKGRRLQNSLIKEIQAISVIECSQFCLMEYPLCKSINYQDRSKFSTHLRNNCQLNNATKFDHQLNLIEDESFNYLEPLQQLIEKELEQTNEAEKNTISTEPFSARFTNLGATGRLGPNSLVTYYDGQDHENMVTLMNGIQHWTVPYTGVYQIGAVGASGGHDNSGTVAKGRGAYMKGDFDLKKGQVIKILVGQQGGVNSGYTSSGGGGGTFVVTSADLPLIIAGGGGGIESLNTRLSNCDASTGTSGKTNQCSSSCASWSGGVDGKGGLEADTGNSGGGGGGFKSNGRSSAQFGGAYGNGGEGGRSFLNGGEGGRPRSNNGEGGFGGGGGAYGHGGGAGGGGGYSGGTSGDNVSGSCGGGGGSYNAGRNQNNVSGYQANGHGFVEINRIVAK